VKVKELKALLKEYKCKPDDEVVFRMASGCCGNFEDLEPYKGFEHEYYKPYRKGDNGVLQFDFYSLPGYRSCLQAGSTKRADEEWLIKHRTEDKK
jgi:hypothetical protein